MVSRKQASKSYYLIAPIVGLVLLSDLVQFMLKNIYLDYNATAPILDAVKTAMTNLGEEYGNPSSVHRFGRSQRAKVEEARLKVARLVNANSHQVVFTSGGTEANNLALTGVDVNSRIVSAIEHDSILNCVNGITVAPVQNSGVIDVEKFEKLLVKAAPPVLVSFMLANNETGVIQPIEEVGRIVKRHGALLHCDAVQGVGRIPVDILRLGIDMMTISAHKLGGPQGVAALIVGKNVRLKPQILGGGQERGLRAGTENVPGIIGFGEAAKIVKFSLKSWNRIVHLRDKLETCLVGVLGNNIRFFGNKCARLPNTTCLAHNEISAETQLIKLDLKGIAVSAGSACSSGKIKTSHVLEAMGVESKLARNAIRISLGPETQETEIDYFLEVYTGMKKIGVEHAA